ncbi:MAG: sterol desaturase family protein [Cyanobacteria bacterium P01_A01_bin.37]
MSLSAWFLTHESAIRLSCFAGTLATMAALEILAPRRISTIAKGTRWLNNITLMVLYTVLVRLMFPVAALGIASFAATRGWGLLNAIDLPISLAIVIAIIVMDFVVWLQHVVFHAVPGLWRLHRVHHADLDYDVTTGIRFHPLEILLSMFIKGGAIALLGAPMLAVLLFEILLNATSLFNHANILLPTAIDRGLRLLVVTPDMHRIHHSINVQESNCNFGFNSPWWDRLFGTYQAQPQRDHQTMTIGITEYRKPRDVVLLVGLLRLPFRNTPKKAAISGH